MKELHLDLTSIRAQKARWAAKIGHTGYESLVVLVVIFTLLASVLFFLGIHQLMWLCFAVSLTLSMPAAWYRYDLSRLPVSSTSLTDMLSADVLARLTPSAKVTPQGLWKTLENYWQTAFIVNRLYVDGNHLKTQLSTLEAEMPEVWQQAVALAHASGSESIEGGHIVAALMLTTPTIMDYMKHIKLGREDIESVLGWLGRVLEAEKTEKPYFGGIGRDWANGFTPRLNEFGFNVSLDIERQGAHFGYLTKAPGVQAIKNAFTQGASAVALIGDTGIGKTSHVSALAQLLLQEKDDRNLEHRQIVALSATTIISHATHPGELEHIVTMLLVEAVHAGHIIIFLDDAQLFFSDGHGAVDVTRILLPAIQSRNIQMVLAMTPHDYQVLKGSNPAFAGLLTPVILQEPAEDDVIRILQDTALFLEHKNNVLIIYEALLEAYKLSGRYVDDMAYPGRAIRLLEQSMSFAENGKIVTPISIQKSIEQAHGVKVGTAAPAEADQLLNLEDRIHERMINQKTAVSAVSSALRRARAGVANPRRPIGSFLFLGPTGVGKTELAKAVAATYFGNESSMIRLDMSEYQQPDDVHRLLSSGASEAKSLIMRVRQSPFAVVLLDEIEKAHPNILNLLLQLLDEGQLTDADGRIVSFKDCIVIATSNAGADTIRARIGEGKDITTLQAELTDHLITSGQFKPELLNRFDEIVFFRPLNQEELAQVVRLMLGTTNQTLSAQKISVELTDAAISKIVERGYDPRLGARPMRRALQRSVEDSIAGRILRGEAKPGDHIMLDADDLV